MDRAPFWWLAALVGGAGCKDTGDDTVSEDFCGLGSTVPAPGSDEACFIDDVEFRIDTWSRSLVGSTIELEDGAGHDVDGSTTIDDPVVVFDPFAPLTPSARYTATLLESCAGTTTLQFTTGAWGEPLDDPNALVGSVYVVDVNDPAVDVGDPLAFEFWRLGPRPLLLQVLAATSDTSASVRVAVAGAGDITQDVCVPTVELEGTFDGPSFAIGPEPVRLVNASGSIEVSGFRAAGTIAPDGSNVGCARFRGLVDTRALAALHSEDPAICPGYAEGCVACADGQDYCVDLTVDGITAPRGDGIVVEAVTAEDVKQNPACKP